MAPKLTRRQREVVATLEQGGRIEVDMWGGARMGRPWLFPRGVGMGARKYLHPDAVELTHRTLDALLAAGIIENTARPSSERYTYSLRLTMNPLEPGAALLAQLGSLIVHADELIDELDAAGVQLPHGAAFDRDTIRSLMAHPDVAAWLKGMRAMAMLPVKR